jgi:hypothetical protein
MVWVEGVLREEWREAPSRHTMLPTNRARLLRGDRQIRYVGLYISYNFKILPPFNQFSCIVASSRGANVPGLRGLRAVAGVKREILQRQRRLVPRPRRPLAQQRDQRPRGDYMYASLGGRPIVNFSDFQSETSENQFLRSMTSSPRTKIISQLKSIGR